MKKYIALLFLLVSVHICAQNDTIGIYYQTNNKLIKIESIRYSKTKTSTLGSALTMGLADSSVKTIYKGASSENIVPKDATFYFYFTDVTKIAPAYIQKNFMFINTNSVKDFVIAKFKTKKDSRELQTAKINIYSGSEMGVADKSITEITSEKVKDGVYKVILNNIESGEYCFMFSGLNGSGAYMPIFDFSVKKL